MGTVSKNCCLSCGNIQTDATGGGMFFEQYRCVKCSMVLDRGCTREKRLHKPPKRCPKCRSNMRVDLMPKCGKCGSRDLKLIEEIECYD